MALIKCPECGNNVSDKASVCIHSGYPLTPQKEEKPQIQVTTTLRQVQSANSPTIRSLAPFYLYSQKPDIVYLRCGKCEKVYGFKSMYFSRISEDSCVPNTPVICPNCQNGCSQGEQIKKRELFADLKKNTTVKCPRCSSTEIVGTTRGFSIWTGFLGSGAYRNACKKCGYKWDPKK